MCPTKPHIVWIIFRHRCIYSDIYNLLDGYNCRYFAVFCRNLSIVTNFIFVNLSINYYSHVCIDNDIKKPSYQWHFSCIPYSSFSYIHHKIKNCAQSNDYKWRCSILASYTCKSVIPRIFGTPWYNKHTMSRLYRKHTTIIIRIVL